MEKIKADEFEKKIVEKEWVILDFSSPGCAPCKRVPPLINEILTELSNVSIAVYEVNVADEPALAQRFFILGVPTVIVFKHGKEVQRFNSVPSKEKLVKLLTSLK